MKGNFLIKALITVLIVTGVFVAPKPAAGTGSVPSESTKVTGEKTFLSAEETRELIKKTEKKMENLKNLKITSESVSSALGLETYFESEMILDYENEKAYMKIGLGGFESETYYAQNYTYLMDNIANRRWSKLYTPGGFSDFTKDFSFNSYAGNLLRAERKSDGSYVISSDTNLTSKQLKKLLPFDIKSLKSLNPGKWFSPAGFSGSFTCEINSDYTLESIKVMSKAEFLNSGSEESTVISYSDYDREDPVKLPEGIITGKR